MSDFGSPTPAKMSPGYSPPSWALWDPAPPPSPPSDASPRAPVFASAASSAASSSGASRGRSRPAARRPTRGAASARTRRRRFDSACPSPRRAFRRAAARPSRPAARTNLGACCRSPGSSAAAAARRPAAPLCSATRASSRRPSRRFFAPRCTCRGCAACGCVVGHGWASSPNKMFSKFSPMSSTKRSFCIRSYGEIPPLGSPVPPNCRPLGPRPGGCVVEDAVLFHDVFAELRDAASALAAVGWRGGLNHWIRQSRANFERF